MMLLMFWFYTVILSCLGENLLTVPFAQESTRMTLCCEFSERMKSDSSGMEFTERSCKQGNFQSEGGRTPQTTSSSYFLRFRNNDPLIPNKKQIHQISNMETKHHFFQDPSVPYYDIKIPLLTYYGYSKKESMNPQHLTRGQYELHYPPPLNKPAGFVYI